MQHLIIDRGHDPKYQGANGVANEVVWVRTVGKFLLEELSSLMNKLAIDVVPDDLGGGSGNGNLINKIKWINAHTRAGTLLVSLHGDGSTNTKARGITICFYGGSSYAEARAKEMLACVTKSSGVPAFGSGLLPDTKARFGRLGMIRDTKPMALLVENGFVTNAQDMAVDPSLYAHGIAQFIRNFFKL